MKLLGRINEEELNEIYAIFQRKTALEELFLALATNDRIDSLDELYNRIVSDKIDVNNCMINWWKEISQKYNWEYSRTDHWKIDFGSGEVFLMPSSEIYSEAF